MRIVILWGLVACGVALGDEGLVAEYKFESIVDNRTDDSSARGNDARVEGTVPLQAGRIKGLLFRGGDFVDCGQGKSLDLRREAAVECWVRPDAIPSSEVVIAGKGTTSYGLTFYTDGQCWWYCAGQSNAVKAPLGVGFWNHVVGTYDGRTACLYVNGKLADRKDTTAAIPGGGAFIIGRGFQGGIAAVHVYDRLLSPTQIAERYKQFEAETTAKVDRITEGPALQGGGYVVRVGAGGGIQIEIGQDVYQVETTLSYPGDTLGWNSLSVRAATGEPTWKPGQESSTGGIVVAAAGANYSLKRVVRIAEHRVVVEDAIKNTGKDDVGILYRSRMMTPVPFAERFLAGADQSNARVTSENPSLFIAQAGSRLGWLAEDAVLRLQLAMSSWANVVCMSADHFALRPGAGHTFRWALYPLPAKADYWSFVNQVRRDWDVNFTVQGPFDFYATSERIGLTRDRDKLKAYLGRKKLKVAALFPWLDYFNYNALTGRYATRPETKTLLQEAMAAFKSVDPEILCIGSMEGNLVAPARELQDAIHGLAPDRPAGQYWLSDEQMSILKGSDTRWKDCLLHNREGRCRYELYYFAPEGMTPMGMSVARVRENPGVALAVYAAPGNGQHLYWLDQARFFLEEAGLDGVYIDQFNMAFSDEQRYSYDKWDGTTVDIDPATGRIVGRYTDAGLVGASARKDLIRYVLGKGRYMLANTYPATADTQSLRMHRFAECEWSTDVFSWPDGAEPPLTVYPCKGHFSTPIALGVRPDRYGGKGTDNYARVVMKTAITYLRHGLLYYHYMSDIPESGPGSGEYGPINHMFPITPVELHEGYVIGRERIVTAVSGTFLWRRAGRPNAVVFDITGRATGAKVEIEQTPDGWSVSLGIKDWQNMAILED